MENAVVWYLNKLMLCDSIQFFVFHNSRHKQPQNYFFHLHCKQFSVLESKFEAIVLHDRR